MVDSTILSEPSSKLLNQIKFNEFNDEEFINLGPQPSKWHLSGLKPINLFTGENNSRKSRLLRAIFNTTIIDFETDRFTLQQFADAIVHSISKNPSQLGVPPNYIVDFQTCIHEKINSASLTYDSTARDVAEIITNFIINKYYTRPSVDQIIQRLNQPLENLFSESKSLRQNGLSPRPHVYIPLLRGLRALDPSNPNNDLYGTRTQKDYFPNTKNKLALFTGISLYTELTQHLLGSHEQRAVIKDYENYLSKTFFEGKDLALVPRLNEDVVYLKVGDFERAIFDLGDGIQSLIILTFKVFTATSPTVFFIEEPEQHLHAGMQRVLIDALSRFDQHMYFMTTHSNHLIDIAQEQDNIAVHRVANRSDGNASEISPLTDYSDALADLGVRASSVLLANCSIWVEGVTDKLYLRAYLEKYLSNLEDSSVDAVRERATKLRQFKENLHYVFTEYQGSNITHWNFGSAVASDDSSTPAKKLNNKIFLLADKDIEGKGDRVKDLTEKLGDKFYMLKWKEIENHIPFDVLVKTAEKRWETFNGRKGLVFKVQKLSAKSKDLFQTPDKGIGAILEPNICNESDGSRKGIEKNFFKAESGTIKDKVKFCHTAIEIMQDKEFAWELTPELNDLCEAIWTHIEESN
ncbi:ATP-binding protein [Vibrio fluvialis]|nr:ATP-binding protein [Vibrio fluvialis]